jgi:N-acetylneuraminate synthase
MNDALSQIFLSKTKVHSSTSYGRVYFIAEIGINHNGDLDLQKRTIEIVYSKEELSKFRESPWGTTQLDQKKGLEFSQFEYDQINEHCLKKGIDWSASAWDLESLNFIEAYNPPFHKIASALATNIDFIAAVAKLNRPTFVSTGMCEETDVCTVVEIFKNFNTPLVLLHSVSTYPSDLEDLNLLCIPRMADKYGVPVGYSGHESSTSPSIVAAAIGAVAIERHITKSRALYGSDQAASLEPQGLSNLVGAVRKVQLIMGDGIKKVNPKEIEVAKKLRYWLKN